MPDLRNAITWALAVGLVLALLTVGVERSRRLEAVTALAKYRADVAEATGRAEAAQREEEARRVAAIGKVVKDAQRDVERARGDAIAARVAGDGLREQLARYRRATCAAGQDSGTASGGPPADAAGDLLADVQRRLDAAADGIAAHADLASAAGRACERAYDALTPGK